MNSGCPTHSRVVLLTKTQLAEKSLGWVAVGFTMSGGWIIMHVLGFGLIAHFVYWDCDAQWLFVSRYCLLWS